MSFPMQDKPNLWPWIRNKLGMEKETLTPPVAREAIALRPPQINAAFHDAVARVLPTDRILVDEDERLLHAYGKSYPICSAFAAARSCARRTWCCCRKPTRKSKRS